MHHAGPALASPRPGARLHAEVVLVVKSLSCIPRIPTSPTAREAQTVHTHTHTRHATRASRSRLSRARPRERHETGLGGPLSRCECIVGYPCVYLFLFVSLFVSVGMGNRMATQYDDRHVMLMHGQMAFPLRGYVPSLYLFFIYLYNK